MPQLNGGGGDDLGANDEMISFKDEGEQEEKISENVSAERDLDDVKSSLVNESESSSDSEVRDLRPHNFWRWRAKSVKFCCNFPSLFSLCQQAERRPQTRADSESYDKARDYFSEGKARLRAKSTQRALCALYLRMWFTNPGLSSSLQHWEGSKMVAFSRALTTLATRF